VGRVVDPYLQRRPTLALCLALVDSNVPPQASDRQLLEFLVAAGGATRSLPPNVTGFGQRLRRSLKPWARSIRDDHRAIFGQNRAGKDEVWS